MGTAQLQRHLQHNFDVTGAGQHAHAFYNVL